MPIHQIIQQRRRALGLTQEQVAAALNVSPPAVSKWETGTTTPDVALLAPLARLLRTDVNTLLGFREEMTDREMGQFCAALRETAEKEGLPAAFDAAEAKLREYPWNDRLRQLAAIQLNGLLAVGEQRGTEAEPYEEKLLAWYERLTESEDQAVRSSAEYFLANRYMAMGDFARAQEILDKMPDREELTQNMADKNLLRADLDLRMGNAEKAQERLQRALYTVLGKCQILLLRLSDAALETGDRDRAGTIAEKTSALAALMELWEYDRYMPLLPPVLSEGDPERATALFRQLLEALRTPWEPERTALFHVLGARQNNTRPMLRAILTSMEYDPQCGFLREYPAFQNLIAEYQAIAAGDARTV